MKNKSLVVMLTAVFSALCQGVWADSLIGINFCDSNAGGQIAGEVFDGLSNWTDSYSGATPESNTMVLSGTNDAVSCDWVSANTWHAGPVSTPEEKMYYLYLDDTDDTIQVSFSGLDTWMAAENLIGYELRIYQNTDNGSDFSAIDILEDGVVLETIQEDNRWTVTGAIRAYVDSGVLSAGEITIDPQNRTGNGGGDTRATIAAIKITGVSNYLPINFQPEAGVEVTTDQIVTWEQSDAIAGEGVIYEVFFGDDPNELSPNCYSLSPVKTTTSDPSDFYYDPEGLDSGTDYYWRVDALEPNTVNPVTYIRYSGPAMNFSTQPDSARIESDPVSVTVAIGTAEVQFAVEGLNVENYQWFKDGEPLADDLTGTKYTGQDSAVLTVLDIDVDDEGEYYCQVDNSLVQPDSSASAELLTKRMVAWWKFDGDLIDSVADVYAGAVAHDGVAVAPIYSDGGLDEGCIEFDGEVDSIITITESSEYFNFYPRGYTVTAWVNKPAVTNDSWGAYVSKQGDAPRTGFVITHDGQGQAVHTLRQAFEIYSGVDIDDETWHFVAATYDADNGEGKVYVDGELITETSGSYQLQTNTMDLIFGAEFPDGSIPYIGKLDNVKIWSYALDPVFVANMYINYNPETEICVEYPEFDFTGPEGARDCMVNVYDLTGIALEWLECNIVPTCIN